jgi:hypothetical protein
MRRDPFVSLTLANASLADERRISAEWHAKAEKYERTLKTLRLLIAGGWRKRAIDCINRAIGKPKGAKRG